MLGWHHLMQGHIAVGTLVYAHPGTVSAGRGNFLKCQSAALARPAVARFVDHLLQSLAEPMIGSA